MNFYQIHAMHFIKPLKLLHMFIISRNNLKKKENQNISLSNVIRSCLPLTNNNNKT